MDAAPAGHRRIATFLLGLSIFATGFCGLVSEFVLSTVSSYILGNSIEQFSVIIALMMLMMGVAGALQKLLPEPVGAAGQARLVTQFIAIEMALALVGGFAPIAIYGAYAYLETHFLLVLYFLAGTLGLLIGFELPLVLRINSAYLERLPSNLAVILSLDYVGGFVGALIWTRWLLRELPLTEIGFVLAGANFAIACATYVYFRRLEPQRRSLRMPLAMAAIAVLLAVGLYGNRAWSLGFEQRMYDHRIVFAETTRYQRVVITENPTTGDVRLFLNGNLQLSSLDEVVYHEQLVHPAMTLAPARARVLILGGGDGLALREVLRYGEVREVTLVDLDPRMTELARTNPRLRALNADALADARVSLVDSPGVSAGTERALRLDEDAVRPGERPVVARVRVVNVDAALFLRDVPGLWDVVIVDLPDPQTVELAKLYSREFYRSLGRVLAPGGLVAVQATSPVHAPAAFGCIRRTLEAARFEVVPYHDYVPSFGSWGFLLAGRPDAAAPPLRARMEAIDALLVDTRYLTPDVVRAALVFGKGRLDARASPVNSLMRPVLLDLYLRESWLNEE